MENGKIDMKVKYVTDKHDRNSNLKDDNENYQRTDSIGYTSVFRAKGNETFMVYIINAQRCINSLVPRSNRNALFTAIT